MTYFLSILAYVLMILVNTLANVLPLNGQTTGEISNKLDVLFTPASYVFSIWGFIYMLLGIWLIRQYPEKNRHASIYKNTRGWFILSSILNSLWIFAWHYEYFLGSVIVMLTLLLTLIQLYKKAKEHDPDFLSIAPFSVYIGWISVATIANISYYLVHIGWDGFGLANTTWTYIMLVVATLLALWFPVKNQDWIYPLVFIWAFIGIGVRNMNDYPGVAYTAYFLAFLIAIGILLVRKR